MFEELKRGLEAPLAGMGTSFSSSLFGLAGSLVLGFLDLQASQAQNRFYTDLEDWLSTITDIAAGGQSQFAVPQYLRLDLHDLQQGIERMNQTLDEALSDSGAGQAGGDSDPEAHGAACRCRAVAGPADARGAEDRAAMGADPVGAECRVPPDHRPPGAARRTAGNAGATAAARELGGSAAAGAEAVEDEDE